MLLLSSSSISISIGDSPIDVGFLSDVAAIEAAVFAFLIPLSIDIISRLDSRYNSRVVITLFNTGLPNRFLPYILATSLAVSIFMHFYSSILFETVWWTILSWTLLAGTVFVLILSISLFSRMKRFLTDPLWLMQQLVNNARKQFK